ncbi:hypothetical protein AcW1_000111 [Taiwanofungus camphoratus]|nr:hypothetical protein AcW2_001397 [Antrodia cinnamomea]KAI0962862.1 hypothetical protein AcW1_000111 [Antrodia cinnamomea]
MQSSASLVSVDHQESQQNVQTGVAEHCADNQPYESNYQSHAGESDVSSQNCLEHHLPGPLNQPTESELRQWLHARRIYETSAKEAILREDFCGHLWHEESCEGRTAQDFFVEAGRTFRILTHQFTAKYGADNFFSWVPREVDVIQYLSFRDVAHQLRALRLIHNNLPIHCEADCLAMRDIEHEIEILRCFGGLQQCS